MNRTIICIYGRSEKGKSTTIKRAAQLLIEQNPNSPCFIKHDFKYDVLLTIQIGDLRIGFESQGDPNSRIFHDDTLKQLADKELNTALGNCDIIVCSARTRGATVAKVMEIANAYDFYTIWLSSFSSPKLNHDVLNDIAAKNIVKILDSLISEKL